MPPRHLGVGLIGSGFVSGLHVESWQSVRHADINAIYSRNAATAGELADTCRATDVGDPSVYADLAAMVADPSVDAVWVCVPNHLRVPMIETVCDEVRSGRAELTAIAIEKPLGRTLGEARHVRDMVIEAGLLHGYLENQVFAPALTRSHTLLWHRGAPQVGAPYLARSAEEHNGPHRGWFWNGADQGGGVLNDMMCHSVEVGRHLLSPPGEPDWVTPKSVEASIASLKWTRSSYADELASSYPGEVDYRRAPAEDYAKAEVTYENGDGQLVVAESTTSWGFVGAGLRLTYELLGPEYSLMLNTLEPEAKVFLSRRLQGPEGEALVEKQNAEHGVMPMPAQEVHAYGYIAEDRHMITAFREGRQPDEDCHDGLVVTELLMACYLSAELGERVAYPVADLDDFVPAVARGEWDPRVLAKAR
jgi:predicted dehydrogenase